MQITITIANINDLSIKNEDILEWLNINIYTPMDISFDTVEDFVKAQELMRQYANQYTFLVNLKGYIKTGLRTARAMKYKKEDIDTLVDRKALIEDAIAVSKTQMQTVSRMITLKQEINRELSINEYRNI